MDVLKPPLIQIGNRCYRRNIISNPFEADKYEGEHVMRAIEEDDYTGCEFAAEEVCTAGLNIEKTQNGYQMCMSLPSALYGYIIGKKGETKKRVEIETRTKITFPRTNASGDIVIQGADRASITSAHSRLTLLAETARKSTLFTHFLSLPMCSENIRTSLEEFKREVLESCVGDNIDSTIFQNPAKLHLTIGTLTLLDTSEVIAASKVLEEAQRIVIDDILGGRGLEVEVQGLEYMNDDPEQVDVLYAKVAAADGSNTLQKLADRLVDFFVSSRLMTRQYDRVKLHMTVINSLMRRPGADNMDAEVSAPRSANKQHRSSSGRESFKASRLLKEFGEYYFGKHYVSSIHLSQKEFTGVDGYYAPAATLDLPSAADTNNSLPPT